MLYSIESLVYYIAGHLDEFPKKVMDVELLILQV